jgi:predicted ArsR family transcriptional regulator
MEPHPQEVASSSAPPGLSERLARLGVLQEPLRRALYLYVAARPGEVSRDEAAEAMGIRRSLAAFHLDKLADAGLLEVDYRRLTGRTGPGAGRPAKLYRRSSEAHQVSLPPREYELAAHLLASAVEQAGRRTVDVEAVARDRGVAMGREWRGRLEPRPGGEHQVRAMEEVLSRYGFEPSAEGGEVRLRNCPFHSLARDHRALACGMNLALIEGVVTGLSAAGLSARLNPRPDGCCVVLAPTSKNKMT